MAGDAQDVEQDLVNDLREWGATDDEIAAAFTLLQPQPQSQQPDSSNIEGGFFRPPSPEDHFVDLGNSPQRQAVDFSPQFGPGAGERFAQTPLEKNAASRTALAANRRATPYLDTDAVAELTEMDPAILARLQDRLAALSINVGSRGVPDTATINGFNQLLRIANARGELWNYTLAFYEKAKADGAMDALPGDGDGGELAGYTAPDYRSVGLEVRNRFRQALGRDPTEGELRLFSDELMTSVSTQRRREAEAAGDQTQPLTGSDIGTPDLVSADEVGARGPLNEPQQQGDPMARFEELFAQKVSGEEALLRASDETSASAGLARSNIERSAEGS